MGTYILAKLPPSDVCCTQRSIKLYFFIYLAYLFEVAVSQQDCFKSPFPKVVGTGGSNNHFNQIDFDDATGAFAVAGATWDSDLIKDASITNWAAIIIYYEGILASKVWGKIIQLDAVMFVGVSFSPDGSIVLGYTKNQILGGHELMAVFSAIDGRVISIRQFPIQYNMQREKRLFLIDSLNQVYINVNNGDQLSNVGYVMLRYSPYALDASLTPQWAVLSQDLLQQIMGTAFGESEQILYNLVRHQSGYVSIGRIKQEAIAIQAPAIPVAEWEARVTYSITSQDFSHLSAKVVGSNGDSLVVGILGTNSVIIVIKVSSKGLYQSGSIYNDVANQANRYYGCYIKDSSTIYALVRQASQVVIQQINLQTGVIKNTKTLPPIPTSGGFRLGVMFSETRYYLIFAGASAILDDSGATKMAMNGMAVVYSSVTSDMCFTFTKTPLADTTLSLLSAATVQSNPSYIQSLNIALTLDMNMPIIDVDDKQLVPTVNWCSEPTYYLSSVQDKNTFTFSASATPIKIPFTPFTLKSTPACSFDKTAFMTYSISLANGNPAPFFVTVSENSPEIQVGKVEEEQLLSLVVTGSTPNGLSLQQGFTIEIGPLNLPPKFTTALKDLTMKSLETQKITLPPIIDPEGDLFTMTTDFGQAKAFIRQIGGDLILSPQLEDSGSFTLKFTLRDKSEFKNTQIYEITLTVIPLTEQELTELKASQGNSQIGESLTAKERKGKTEVKVKLQIKQITSVGMMILTSSENAPLLLSQINNVTMKLWVSSQDNTQVEFSTGKVYGKSVEFRLNFMAPVSQGQEMDIISGKILTELFFIRGDKVYIIEKDVGLKQSIPPQISQGKRLQNLQFKIDSQDLVEQVANAIQVGQYIFFTGNILVNILLQITYLLNLSQLWPALLCMGSSQ
ncbi:hypothetical protein FGO68_gene9505 [Halteria grandinella]|uniref:Uncharacterized protein n=1 Tax=Halteria grandinella TaxID=5974 RepID=A0A8J8P3T6_HALGN|nr:hypothetical protein FGO68_gene9505 [Halteria grandinella]